MFRDHPPQTWAEATWDVARELTHRDPHTAVITGEVHTAAGRLPATADLTDVQRLRMAAELTDVRRTADRTTVLPHPHTVVVLTVGLRLLTAAVELRRTVAVLTVGLRLHTVAAGLRLTVAAECHPLAAVAAQADTAAAAAVTHLLEVEATAAAEVVVVTAVVAELATAVDIIKKKNNIYLDVTPPPGGVSFSMPFIPGGRQIGRVQGLRRRFLRQIGWRLELARIPSRQCCAHELYPDWQCCAGSGFLRP
jgi:hypothetical protein